MKTTAQIFSENLRRLLEEKNKTQRTLARLTGTTEATVSRWVNGEVVPRHAKLDLICEVLMCSPEDLMLDKDKTAVFLPEDVVADELRERPLLFRLMIVAMRADDEAIRDAIMLLKK